MEADTVTCSSSDNVNNSDKNLHETSILHNVLMQSKHPNSKLQRIKTEPSNYKQKAPTVISVILILNPFILQMVFKNKKNI